MKKIFLSFAFVFILIGCSSAYEENRAEADKSLKSGDYENALHFYELSLEDEPDNTEVQDRISLLKDYETLEVEVDNSNWKQAHNLANDILKNDSITPSLKNEVKESETTIKEEMKNEGRIANELDEINKQISNKEIDKANSMLNKLERDIETDEFDKEIDTLNQKLDTAEKLATKKDQKDQEAKEKKERLEEEKEEKLRRTTEENSLQSKYLQKVDNLEKQINTKIQKESPDAKDMDLRIYGQYYNEWDDLLNEVWGVLKDTMANDEFENLKIDQREWVEMKEGNLNNDSSDSKGYLALETASRTIDLINYYMN